MPGAGSAQGAERSPSPSAKALSPHLPLPGSLQSSINPHQHEEHPAWCQSKRIMALFGRAWQGLEGMCETTTSPSWGCRLDFQHILVHFRFLLAGNQFHAAALLRDFWKRFSMLVQPLETHKSALLRIWPGGNKSKAAPKQQDSWISFQPGKGWSATFNS